MAMFTVFVCFWNMLNPVYFDHLHHSNHHLSDLEHHSSCIVLVLRYVAFCIPKSGFLQNVFFVYSIVFFHSALDSAVCT